MDWNRGSEQRRIVLDVAVIALRLGHQDTVRTDPSLHADLAAADRPRAGGVTRLIGVLRASGTGPELDYNSLWLVGELPLGDREEQWLSGSLHSPSGCVR